jgi:colanic acid biosynthesis glycosyl transferase WcaI
VLHRGIEKMNSKQKSVLYVMGFNCPFPGAGWNRVSYIAKYLKDNGVDCSLLSTFEPRELRKMGIKEAKNIRIYNILPQFPISNPVTIVVDNLLAFIYSFPLILTKKPDIIIVSIAPAHQLLSLFWISKILRRKFIVDIRDEVDENFIDSHRKPSLFYKAMKCTFTKIYCNSFLVTPVTKAVADNLIRRGVSSSKIHIVADGVDTSIFKMLDKKEMKLRLAIPEKTFVLLFLGRVYPAYRVETIVEALVILRKNVESKNKYLFLLAGGGCTKVLLQYAEKLGVGDAIKYVGEIKDQQEVVKVINAADIGIIPYYTNVGLMRMYPTKLFEYSACGLPVIATYYEESLLAEFINKFGLGITVPPGDGSSLALAIEKMSQSISEDSRYCSNALSFADKNKKEKIADAYLQRLLKK